MKTAGIKRLRVAALAISATALAAGFTLLQGYPDCESTANNGRFEVTFGGIVRDGSLVQYDYTIVKTGDHRLSHTILELAAVNCATYDIQDLLVGVYFNGAMLPHCDTVGAVPCWEYGTFNDNNPLPPGNPITGLKFNNVPEQDSHTVGFVLDESALPEGYELYVGPTTIWFKASNEFSPASICGPVCRSKDPPEEIGEGCTPGYWKNHLDDWAATGYSPSQRLDTVFTFPGSIPLGGDTLMQALNYGGGSGVVNAARILLRAAVAALLNASHPDVDYWYTPAEVIAMVNAALASEDRETILDLAEDLDEYNNAGCPIGEDEPPCNSCD